MTLRIEQSASYTGDDYWNWSVWLAGEPSELARVDKVTWFLHPSFSPSIIESGDRASGFQLDTSGWGVFQVRATAHQAGGVEVKLKHNLKLYYPDERPGNSKEEMARRSAMKRADESPRVPKVFLSYGSEDRRRAEEIRHGIESRGVLVLDSSKLEVGAPWDAQLRDMLRNSDGVVAVVSSEFPSPFLAEEVNFAISNGKPTIVLTTEKVEGVLGLPKKAPVMKLGEVGKFEVAGLDSWLQQLPAAGT